MKAEAFEDGILLTDGSALGFSKTLQPEEAQELAWQLLKAAHSVHNERKYADAPDQTLEEFLESHPPTAINLKFSGIMWPIVANPEMECVSIVV
jgi:hypothetical protein